jgi:glycosyltransferase involved in cell wall biosynthesis
MTVLYISDLDLKGSGYANIAFALCTHLSCRGYDVQAIGLGYNGEEHHFPFRIAPCPNVGYIVPIVNELRQQGIEIEAIVTALDIPLQEAVLKQFGPARDIPYIGIFPLEAGPLCQSWAMSLLQMDKRLVMSEFGTAECEAVGVDATHIPIGVDCEAWNPPTVEERAMFRKGLGIPDDSFVVLTVADNQERKNLSRAMEIYAGACKGTKSHYLMVTRPNSPVGWKLQDYAVSLGIFGQMNIWDRGMSFKQLWSLFAVADCFLLTSKAEGLAMPVLEAMSMRLPVIGTKCAAIEEHLTEGRGLLIEPDYVLIDPWGNSMRYFAGLEEGIYQMRLLRDGMSKSDVVEMLDRAQEYVLARRWEAAADSLIEAIEGVKQPLGEVDFDWKPGDAALLSESVLAREWNKEEELV